MNDQPSFIERRNKLLAERGELPAPPSALKPPVAPVIAVDPNTGKEWDADLIPDIEDDRSESERAIDATLDRIGVIDAYKKWCGKKIDMTTINRTEGVMVSCPMPGHRDNNPSAWLNTKDDVWFCGGCNVGGDIYDLAAFAHGFDVPGYKVGADFHKLREAMAGDFGTNIKRVANNEEIVWYDEPVKEIAPEPSVVVAEPSAPVTPSHHAPPIAPPAPTPAPEEQSQPLAAVTKLPLVPEDEPDQIKYPTLDWRSIVPQDTFLWEYMVACSSDDSPEEYHFWNGMLALGHAVGRRVVLRDRPAVVPNLLLCMLGGTGVGKSKSRSYLNRILHEVFPFDGDGPEATGVKSVSLPGSGEFLIKQFTHIYSDPSLGKAAPIFRSPVNGIVDFDEFAGMLGRANRQGSSLKTTIMAMADAAKTVKVGSLTHGEFIAQEPYCSITASTQPKAIRTLVSRADAGSGFLNRWLFVSGGEKEKVVFGDKEVDLSRPIDRYKEIKGWGARERQITIAEDAIVPIIDFFQNVIYPARKIDDTDLLARTDLAMKKILLLLTINNKESEVTLDTFNRAKPIYAYLVKCYGLIHAEIGITINHEIGIDMVDAIKRFKQKNIDRVPTQRDIQRMLERKKYTPQQYKQTLDNLVALDWIEVVKPKAGQVGRPSIRYDLAKEA